MTSAILWLCLNASAASPEVPASTEPDEGWAQLPRAALVDGGTPSPDSFFPDIRDSVPESAKLPAPPPPPRVQARVASAPRPVTPEDFNNVSVYGAPTLGQWKRALGVYMGFPLLGARFSMGLLKRLDAGVAFDSLYGVMNDVRLHLKWQFLASSNWTGAVAAEGGPAFFAEPPQSEGNGPRWLTGRRDWNFAPGVIFSYRGDSPRSPQLFLDARCALAFDTEPYATSPLSGVPAAVTTAANFPVRAGAEMPFSSKTSFLFVFGFDVHTRPQDSPVMIDVSVGIVTSL